MAHSRSLSVNTYGMFQPSDPNFFRSNMTAWKKHSPNTIRRQSDLNAANTFDFSKRCTRVSSTRQYYSPLSSKKSIFMSANDLFRFALIPLGGSLVTFSEFCNTKVGKLFEGIELRNSLKSDKVFDGFSINSCIIFSMSSIHDDAR